MPAPKHSVEIYDGDADELYDGDALISGSIKDVRKAAEVIDPAGSYLEELWDDGHIHGGQEPTVSVRVPDSNAVDIENKLLDAGWIRDVATHAIVSG